MGAPIIIYCKSCGASNVVEAPYCHICGEPMRYELNPTYSGTVIDRLRSFLSSKPLSAQAVSYEVVGNDISEYQGVINFDILRTKAQFAIIRAGAGNNYVDVRLSANYGGCVEHEIVPQLYWFIKPDKDALKTAEGFFTQWSKYPTKLPPVHDIETSGGLAKTPLQSWLEKYFRRFLELSGLDQSQNMIYTSAYFWNTFLPICGWEKYYLLFVAHWTTAVSPLLPRAWGNIVNPREWTDWQHSSRCSGSAHGAQSQYIDCDRYNGTLASFNLRWGVNAQPLPSTPTPSISYSFSPSPSPSYSPSCVSAFVKPTTTPYLKVRKSPNTDSTVLGYVYPDSYNPIADLAGNDIWAQLRDGQYAGGWICIKKGTAEYCDVVIDEN